ncbi:GL19403 [Drosophila persimilis]|uniref:GL19403 n=1 Tax=Drosophila persimilis TaxID=7234 RepID=B4G937_DROPE|nr:GL19403 [Drosophila persimilis]
MQYLADANFRQNLNPRMFGQRPPYFPGRVGDRSVPSVDEILGRGEAMPGRYLVERPPPSPPQNSAWSSSPRRTDRRDVDFAKDDASYMYAFQANPPGSPTDPSLGDYSKDPPNYANIFRENVAGGPSEEGSPTGRRRGGSPVARRGKGAPIDAIPRLCGPPMGPIPDRCGPSIARRRNGDPLYAIPGLCGSPMGPIPGRCGSPMGPIPGRCGSPDYANIFGRNPPGGQAMFSDRRALLLNPFDPRPCIPNSIQSRRLGHWSSFEDGSSENGRGNRSFPNFDWSRSSQDFQGNRRFQVFEGNGSSQDFQGNRRFQAFEGNGSSHNFEGNRSSQYLNDFEDYRSDNDSGFIDGRPRCDAGRRSFENFGNFGGSNEANDGRIQGIGGHSFQPLESYHPEMGRKRRAEEFDNWQPEKEKERVRVRGRGRGKRPCPEKAVFRIGGFRLDNASHCGGRRKLPQPEEMSHAVRFFKRYPVYRIRAKKSQMADSVKYHFMEEDGAQDDDDAFIRHTIAEEWVKVYAARNYRSWASWWSDFEDCGRAIAKELERFDGFTVKRNFEPPEGPIDSEAYLGMAVVALEENNITYLKNMRYLYRLIDFNVLRNLSANASGHLQDIIRSIPNHLWRYKMRSFVFLWSWYHKMANSQTPDGQTNHQAILQLWNNPVLHWLAKQAFDETVAISKIEYKGFKAAQLQGPRKGLLPLPQPQSQPQAQPQAQAHPEDQS